MKSQRSEVRSQKSRNLNFQFNIKFVIRYSLLITILSLLVTCYPSLVTASEKWSGVDESVVEKYAKEYGREAREPLINTDQGDLLLFVFLIAGAVGGFAAGYYWRILTEVRSQGSEYRLHKTNKKNGVFFRTF